MNHFAKMCEGVTKYRDNQRKRESIHQMNVYEEYKEESDYEDEYEEIMMVGETGEDVREKMNSIKARMIVVGEQSEKEITFQIDSGATVNVVPQRMVPEETMIEQVNRGLRAWNNAKITPMGECQLRIKNKKDGKKYKIKVMVVKEDLTPLLGWAYTGLQGVTFIG